MRESCQRTPFAPETLEIRRRRQNLQGDCATQRLVVCTPDLRHRSMTLELFEPVAAGDLISGLHNSLYLPVAVGYSCEWAPAWGRADQRWTGPGKVLKPHMAQVHSFEGRTSRSCRSSTLGGSR